MILSLIAAADEKNVIGNRGGLPWKMPADMAHFRRTTEGHPIIMGRKTFESIGRPLPRRLNIVVTKTVQSIAGCKIADSLESALTLARQTASDEAFVIGGGQLYRQALPRADRIYLTRIHHQFEGDTFFPSIDESEWQKIREESHPADLENPYPYTFFFYERRRSSA